MIVGVKMSLFQRRLTAWIAACAILMASLAPAVSHAMEMYGSGAQASFAGTWTQICTVHGNRFVQLDDNATIIAGKRLPPSPTSSPSPASKLMHLEHCPYCSLHADHPALPGAPAVLPAAADSGRMLPALFLQARQTLFAWRGPQPRAPPSPA